MVFDSAPLPPLHVAVFAGDTDAALKLLRAGADVNRVDSIGRTALHIAAESKHVALCTYLLKFGANADAQDGAGVTPLMLAASTGNAWLIKTMLERRADFRIRDKRGRAVLHHVVFDCFDTRLDGRPAFSFARRLTGLAVLAEIPGIDVNERDVDGATPLHLAAHCWELVAKLLEISANPHLADNAGRTPFDVAAESGAVDAVHMLHQGKEADEVVLRFAAARGDNPLAKRLLDKGVNGDASGPLGETALFNAAYPEGSTLFHGHKALVRLLLRRGANANAVCANGATLLHLAARDGREPLAQDLLSHGARHDVRDESGRTPLHLAAMKGRVSVARMLLRAGAVMNAKDDTGATPLHLAANPIFGKRAESIVSLLIEAGADREVRDIKGRLPADYAAEDDAVVLRLLTGGSADEHPESPSHDR